MGWAILATCIKVPNMPLTLCQGRLKESDASYCELEAHTGCTSTNRDAWHLEKVLVRVVNIIVFHYSHTHIYVASRTKYRTRSSLRKADLCQCN